MHQIVYCQVNISDLLVKYNVYFTVFIGLLYFQWFSVFSSSGINLVEKTMSNILFCSSSFLYVHCSVVDSYWYSCHHVTNSKPAEHYVKVVEPNCDMRDCVHLCIICRWYILQILTSHAS